MRQVNADDRVNTVLRRGGAGELDDVALLNAGQVRGLIGVIARVSVGAAAREGSVTAPSVARAVVTSVASSWTGRKAFDLVCLMCTAGS